MMPSSEAPIPNPMRRTLRITVRCMQCSAGLLVLGIVAALLVPSQQPAWETCAILACTWGGLGLLVCPFLLWTYRKAARQAEAILAGSQCVARWTCTAAEWDRYLRVVRARAQHGFHVVLWILGVSLLIGGGVAVYALATDKEPVSPAAVGAICAVILGTLALCGWLSWLALYGPVRRLRHLANREVCIGFGGLVAAGKFSSWEVLGASLECVRYEPGDPGTLLFRWAQPGAGFYGRSAQMEVVVPVPQRHHAEAHHVVEVFNNQFKHQA
jgi:hypothetical protein